MKTELLNVSSILAIFAREVISCDGVWDGNSVWDSVWQLGVGVARPTEPPGRVSELPMPDRFDLTDMRLEPSRCNGTDDLDSCLLTAKYRITWYPARYLINTFLTVNGIFHKNLGNEV